MPPDCAQNTSNSTTFESQQHKRHASFSVSISARRHRRAPKGPYELRPVSQQSPKGCPRNSVNVCLVEYRSFPTSEDGMTFASFLNSSLRQAINAVMLWLSYIQKVPQAPEHLGPTKLRTRCDICCGCQSIRQFIPADTGVPRAVDLQKSLQPKTVCMAVCQSEQPIADSIFCSRFIECVRMIACVICASRWEASRARIYHRPNCSDKCTCRHTEIRVPDQTSCLTQSQSTDAGPTSASANPIAPGVRQGSTREPVYTSLV